MSPTILKEYRCSCGRLLFKAFLFFAIVEVKCRRCSEIQTSRHFESGPFAFLTSDAEENMQDVYGDVPAVFGCEREYFLGKSVRDVFPRIGEARMQSTHPDAGMYGIQTNSCRLRDGTEMSLTSYVIPKKHDGVFSGCLILNVPVRSDKEG